MKNGFELAFSLTQPAVIQSSITTLTTTVEGVATVGAGNLGNSWIATCTATPCAAANPYSTNLAPDLILKLAYDNAKLGHFELKGVGRAFRDRIAPAGVGTIASPFVGGYNAEAYGWGVGGGVFTPIVKGNKMNFALSGMYGKGISRYESTQGPDFIVRTATDNKIQPEKSASAYVGFESHPTKKTEVDFTLGGEYYWRTCTTVPSLV